MLPTLINNARLMEESSPLCSSLEDCENQIIQHLRTSGIRKPREIELINEVIHLRQERRKSLSTLDSLAKKHSRENINLKLQIASLLDNKASEAALSEESTSKILRKKDDEIQMIIKRYDKMLRNEKAINIENMRSQADHLNSVNKGRLQAVDKKIAELMMEKSSQDNKIAEAIAFEMTSKAVAELNAQHNLKLQKLVSLSTHF